MHAEFLQPPVASTTEYLAYIPNFRQNLRTKCISSSVKISKASKKPLKVVFYLETPNEESTILLGLGLLVAA